MLFFQDLPPKKLKSFFLKFQIDEELANDLDSKEIWIIPITIHDFVTFVNENRQKLFKKRCPAEFSTRHLANIQ